MCSQIIGNLGYCTTSQKAGWVLSGSWVDVSCVCGACMHACMHASVCVFAPHPALKPTRQAGHSKQQRLLCTAMSVRSAQ